MSRKRRHQLRHANEAVLDVQKIGANNQANIIYSVEGIWWCGHELFINGGTRPWCRKLTVRRSARTPIRKIQWLQWSIFSFLFSFKRLNNSTKFITEWLTTVRDKKRRDNQRNSWWSVCCVNELMSFKLILRFHFFDILIF